jgi:hypothetical protein
MRTEPKLIRHTITFEMAARIYQVIFSLRMVKVYSDNELLLEQLYSVTWWSMEEAAKYYLHKALEKEGL